MLPFGDNFWAAERDTAYSLLFPVVEESTHRAVMSGWEMLQVDIDLNWRLVNEQARAWAQQYTYALVSQVNSTTVAVLQDELSGWIASGEPLDVLIEALTPTFGPVRSEMIGVTEITRVFAEGNRLAWLASEVVDAVQWYTVYDDLVCVQCEPLNGEKADIKVMDFNELAKGGPPLHVRCRCYLQPIVNVAKWLRVWRHRKAFEKGRIALPWWVDRQVA